MIQGYVVYRGGGWERRYFTRFINGIPYISKQSELAKIFEDREMAEAVAKKCEEYTGRKFTIKEVNKEERA